MAYRLAAAARSDLLEAWNYIADDSERAADDFIGRIIRFLELLAQNPYIGRKRDELHSGYRSFPVGEHVVFYRIEGSDVIILRVLHGRRDLQSL